MYQFNSDLISRMKIVAKEHTIFVEDDRLQVANGPCLWEKIQYNDEDDLNLILTYEVVENKDEKFNAKVWHLSIIKSDESQISQQTANEIASDVLGENAKEIPPESFPPEFRFMKQFVLQD